MIECALRSLYTSGTRDGSVLVPRLNAWLLGRARYLGDLVMGEAPREDWLQIHRATGLSVPFGGYLKTSGKREVLS